MSDYPNPLTDYSPQMESNEPSDFARRATANVFSEDDELELASEFLEINNEEELQEFVDGLIKQTEHGLNATVDPSMEQDLGDILKSVAKVALPIAGGVLGGYFGGPAGAALGSNLASQAGHAFGLELEGLSPEDSEFEVSKQFVRFAGTTVKNALEAAPHTDPAYVARSAAVKAAQMHAPGLMNVATRDRSDGAGNRGRSVQPSSHDKGDMTVPNLNGTQNGSQSNGFRGALPRNAMVLSEEEQIDIASELMELESEEEFENFLGDLISHGAEAAGKFISSPTGQALGQVLKDTAKQLLPVAGQAVGTYFGGSTGGQIGGALGTAASNLFEAESEEQEWEAANTFVKVVVDAVNNAGDAPAGTNPDAVARDAVAEAIHVHAPHLADAYSRGGRSRRRQHSGRWVQHGGRIFVIGA
jgi:uncharacterized protein (DUF697 family)